MHIGYVLRGHHSLLLVLLLVLVIGRLLVLVMDKLLVLTGYRYRCLYKYFIRLFIGRCVICDWVHVARRVISVILIGRMPVFETQKFWS